MASPRELRRFDEVVAVATAAVEAPERASKGKDRFCMSLFQFMFSVLLPLVRGICVESSFFFEFVLWLLVRVMVPCTVQGGNGHGNTYFIVLLLQVTSRTLLYSVLAAPHGHA